MLNTDAIYVDSDRHQQNRKIFTIYNVYRLVLSLILLISFIFASDISSLGIVNPELFFQTAAAYTVFNAIVLLRAFLPKQKIFETVQFIAVTMIDIIALVMISYTCGGVSSGMAHMLIVPVAAASILFQNRLATFMAAVGTLAAIYSEFYLYVTLDRTGEYYFQVGLLGLTLFAISLVLQYLSAKIRQNELLARQQAKSIQSLEEMNYQIIQKMRTGIIVVDSAGEILNINSSAIKLLSTEDNSRPGLKLPQSLMEQLNAWKMTGQNRGKPFRLSKSSPQLQASFSFLQPETQSDVLIFLEDYSWLTSRAQQLKLISLGRLTASIAHEIRNPLGAISHAGQLLEESETASEDDRRLLDIIASHTSRVNSIIDNVLQLSRNKGEALDTIDLNEWLDQFSNKFSNSYREDVEFELEPSTDEVTVRFNESQLEQIMTNLCDNGIRYSMKYANHPHVHIRVSTDSRTRSPVVDIIDDGPGIKPEHEEHLFEPFFTTETTGTGLGLFICKEICEANQAQLSFFNTDNNKTCFRIHFAHPDRNIM